MKAKPFIKWVGGKSQLIEQLEAKLPADFDNWENVTYIEPFVGGGAMLFYMLQTHPNIKSAIINDINEKLIKFYKGVRNHYPKVRQELDEIEKFYTQYSYEFDALKKLYPDEIVTALNEEMLYHLRAQFNGTEKQNYSDAALYNNPK